MSMKDIQKCVEEELHTIGINLKTFRLERDMTQSDVAFYIFTDKSLISALERGVCKNVTLHTLTKLCKLFDKKIEDLFKT